MTTAFFLIVLGTLSRLAPHPPNAVAMGALALYAGARLPRRWAYLVPIVAMAASDLWLDWGGHDAALTLVRLTSYVTFAGIVAAGRLLLTTTTSPMRRMGLSVMASTAFFVTTNLAVWLSPQVASLGHPTFPPTTQGLAECFVAALPFYRNSLVADLIGTAVLFSLDGIAYRIASRRKAPALVVE